MVYNTEQHGITVYSSRHCERQWDLLQQP
jgi:hypothetical protein